MLNQNILSQWSGESRAYVVGGAVRDLLMGKSAADIDILLPHTDFESLLLELEGIAGKPPYPVKQEHKIWRFSFSDATTIDVSPLDSDLRTNLRIRDFTVNAMALPLGDFLSGNTAALIDPCGGSVDIVAKRLVPTGPNALRSDAVRILRGVKLVVEKGFSPSLSFVACARENVRLLRRAPGERIWPELARILVAERAVEGIELLDHVGVLSILFPELSAGEGVKQNMHHQYCVYEHSRRAFAEFVRISHSLMELNEPVRQRVRAEVKGLPMRTWAVFQLGALLHDLGKPGARGVRENGRVTFYRHEQIGAEMVPAIAARLRLSREEAKNLKDFVLMHTYLAQLVRSTSMTDGYLHRVASKLQEVSLPVALFSLADLLAKGEDRAQSVEYEAMLTAVNAFLEALYFRRDTVIDPSLPLDGSELALGLDMEAGPWVGQVLSHLKEMVANGRHLDKQEALAEARRHLAKKRKR